MPGGHSILRDIHVSVVRADARPKHAGHPAYVFAVQPRVPQTPLQRSRLRLFSQSSMNSLLASPPASWAASSSSSFASLLESGHSLNLNLTASFQDEAARARARDRCLSSCSTVSSTTCPPVLHEVARTYSQCRRLYYDLIAYTNCTSTESCSCLNGSCPFWTMYLLLQAFPFPRKTLFQSRETCRRRMEAFNGLMLTIFDKLQTYKEEYFVDRTTPHGCRVLAALEDFLDLSDDFACRFREMDSRMQLKLNLRGWHSDRKNLYFQDEDDATTRASHGTNDALQKPSQPMRRDAVPCSPIAVPVPLPSPLPLPSPATTTTPHDEGKPVSLPFDDLLSPVSDVEGKNELEASGAGFEPLLSPLCCA